MNFEMASRSIGCTSSILRFPRRHPLSLLVLIIPLVLLIYNFELHGSLRFTRTHISPSSVIYNSVSSSKTPSQDSSTHPSATDDTRILLVSGFYPIANSEHSMRDYKHWLSLFLSRITTDIYFFTPADWEPMIREIRGDLPIRINTTFSSSFDIPPLQDRRRDYERMRARDREQHLHSPEDYAVLTSKPYFLMEGVSNTYVETGRKYKYAFWTDATIFRHNHPWQHWPSPERVDDIWAEGVKESGTKAEDLVFFPLEGIPHSSMNLWSEGMGPIDNPFSEGSSHLIIIDCYPVYVGDRFVLRRNAERHWLVV